MTEPTDKSGPGTTPKESDDETVIAGHSSLGQPERSDEDHDADGEDATVIRGGIEEDDEDEVTHIRSDYPGSSVNPESVLQGDVTLAQEEGLPVGGDTPPMSATKIARRSGRTTLLPGQVSEDTLAPAEHPDGNPQETRQALKARRDTLFDNSDEAARQYREHDENIVRDRFVILERLGKGGMGEVFKARDLMKVEAEDDNPYVAIKFLGEAFVKHPRALISLQREAKRSQQLAHPNILTVYDFDRDGDKVYMTMEYLDGAPLSGWDSIEFNDNREPTTFQIIEDMANGLIYAHEHGVVHSDLKPDNVFATVDGRVKILDFGIARIMDSALEKDNFDAGELGALTMRYASLEMLQGGKDPHPADDIYALGLMAYQLIAGEHPYNGKNAFEAMRLGLTPAPLKGLKSRQRKAIEKAIAFERADRTQSAAVFLNEFSGKRSRNLALVAAIFALTLSSGYFAYEASLREGPAIPFEELPISVQQDFTITIAQGQQSIAAQDWSGVSEYFTAAYELHPRNPMAEEGLETLAQYLVKAAQGMESDRQKKYLLDSLKSYSSNEYLANHEALTAERLRLEQELAKPAQ